ncbi:MAG: hypothetical protein J6X33_09250 [Clostridiales bacterium]|nr:hypothetical protein [Clostridiales bacterium]
MKRNILILSVCSAIALALGACSTAAPAVTTDTTTTSSIESTAEETTESATDPEETTESTTGATTESSSETTTEAPSGNGPDETSDTTGTEETSGTEDTVPDYAPANITVDTAENLGLDKDSADYVDVSDKNTVFTLGFKTDIEISDFQILELEIADIDTAGNPIFKCKAVHTMDKLTPSRPLIADVTFAGDIPNVGFMYKDTDGSAKAFTIGLSGDDGSVIVSKISNLQ